MSTPNQPGSDQKSESSSGSTPSKPEQATAPAGAGGSGPSAAEESKSSAAGAQAPSTAAAQDSAGKPAVTGAGKPAAATTAKPATPAVADKPVVGAGKPAAVNVPEVAKVPEGSDAPKGSDVPKGSDAAPSSTRGNQPPPWQRGKQGIPQQREPQTNITRSTAPAAPPKPQAAPPSQAVRTAGNAANASARPVVSGIAAPTVANKVVGNKTVVPPKGPNPAAGNSATAPGKTIPPSKAVPPSKTAAPTGAKAKAAAIDGPTRHISRKDLPKDMPDLSEAKHPLPQAIASDKSHVATAQALDGGPLRATVQIRRIDPWTTLKVSAVISVSLFFVWMVAVGLLYVVLDGMGVWDRLNNAFTDIVSDGGGDGLVTAGQVFGYSAVIGIANMVLFTALVTMGSFIYNLCSDLVGGVEVTLADRD